MNAIAERWARSVRSECLNRMILFGEDMLRRALCVYLEHYHRERPHQGLGNELIVTDAMPSAPAAGEVVEIERLGGRLRHYRRVA